MPNCFDLDARRFVGRPALLALAVLAGCASGPATPPRSAEGGVPAAVDGQALTEQRFAQWVAGFRESARAAGIDEATLHAALDTVQLHHRAVVADRAQPEFTRALWEYLDAVISERRVATGQQKLAEFRAEADAAATRYGVPGQVLMAVWGIESNFGGNYGDVPVFDALATLGFEGRREAWAKSELMAALKIVQRGDVDAARMVGSWAGAMGQTQFMPSSYLSYAVDADGDGRRDIWGSMPDVLASTANFLARSGWRADEPWGVEVQLPSGFDPARADASVCQNAAQWAQEGVRTMDGAALPAMADAMVLQPAGARGPAFLVGRNYRAILRYNNSMSYALTVGLLSQRIAGGPGVQGAWPRDLRALTRGEMIALQTALNQRGFDSGTPDGQMGPATRGALRAFQRSVGQPADGFPTAQWLRLLQSP
ncbi:MAG TPA: lytic murein transglycosylase [Candidatus Aquabacterium excrementipullorum]|nr:lytic murein transglycosylase [Candidatus Aquabacterium excrementipullorum]